MRMRDVALMAALLVGGSTSIVHAQGCGMTLEEAKSIHRSGEIDNIGDGNCARELVKQDIEACLIFYELDECEGPAKVWVETWDRLELPQQPAQESASARFPRLPPPSFLQPHAPFAKSVTDYLSEMSYPHVSATR